MIISKRRVRLLVRGSDLKSFGFIFTMAELHSRYGKERAISIVSGNDPFLYVEIIT